MPFVMRRTKDQVLKDLPPKIIQDVYVDPSPLQQRLYEQFSASSASQQVASTVSADISVESAASKAPHVFQVCMHRLMTRYHLSVHATVLHVHEGPFNYDADRKCQRRCSSGSVSILASALPRSRSPAWSALTLASSHPPAYQCMSYKRRIL